MTSPRFSIIVPCYNQAHFLGDCVESALSQDYDNWELIIVNDGSTDNTKEVATQFCQKDDRIKLINKVNGGLSSARNAGMSVGTGGIFQFLDADDFLLSNCLRQVSLRFTNNPSLGILRVGYQYVSEIEKEIIHQVQPPAIVDYLPFIMSANWGPCHSLFVSSVLCMQIGEFDEKLNSAEDWDFWIRAVKTGAGIQHIPEILVAYRYGANSMSRNAFRQYQALKTVLVRAPQKDLRIKIDSPLNQEWNIDQAAPIKRHLIMCLGVALMQGKVLESVDLWSKEKLLFKTFELSDFKSMYSYLSFRYWNKNSDLRRILVEFYPHFESFFKAIGLTKGEQGIALRNVFAPVKQLNNHRTFGKIIGGLLNRVQR